MTGYYKKSIDELDGKINDLHHEQCNFLVSYEKAIELIINKISELKKYVLTKGFKNQQAEIHFFRYIKPQFIAKLIYYNAIYKIETKKPYGAKPIRKYLNKELKKLKRFFDDCSHFLLFHYSTKLKNCAASGR